MKIQPVESEDPVRFRPVVVKSRLRRFFQRTTPEGHFGKNAPTGESEPSSVSLDRMVQSFIENNNERQSGAVRCGRRCCNCFNRTASDGSDDDFDCTNHSCSDEPASETTLRSLVVCESVWERNLLADTARIVERNKICKRKDGLSRKVVTDGLLSLGYDACICRSRWEKSASYPAGEYEYIDVVIEGKRFLVDIDFRSEFEIARPTKAYRSILNSVPHIFVGKPDRLQKIVGLVCDAARQSLKKRAMHVPPWRRADYVNSKWLSPYKRLDPDSKGESKPVISSFIIPVTEIKNRSLKIGDER